MPFPRPLAGPRVAPKPGAPLGTGSYDVIVIGEARPGKGSDGIAADNRAIQGAYDDNFGHCMAARGNSPSNTAAAAVDALQAVLDSPVSHPEFPDELGPAADAFRQWFVTRPGCFDGQAREAVCSDSVNLGWFKFFYGDAGHGPGADVLVLATIHEDPTGNGDVPMVGYMRRDGAGFRFIRELPDFHAAGIAPGTVVRFTPGRISFVGLTHGQAEGRDFRATRTLIIVPTN